MATYRKSEVKTCLECGGKYVGAPQSYYCSATHKRAAKSRREQELRTQAQQARREVRHSSSSVSFTAAKIQMNAPENSGGYRLVFTIPENGDEITFPVFPRSAVNKGHRSNRRRSAAGRYVYTDYFLLRPFEIPSVPVSGTYRVVYVTADPAHLEMPTHVTEVAIDFPVLCPGSPIHFRPRRNADGL